MLADSSNLLYDGSTFQAYSGSGYGVNVQGTIGLLVNTAGGFVLRVDDAAIKLASTLILRWETVTNTYSNSPSVGMCDSAVGSGILEINNGTRGTLRDLNVRDLTASGNLICSTAGKGLQLKSGTGARGGSATLVAGNRDRDQHHCWSKFQDSLITQDSRRHSRNLLLHNFQRCQFHNQQFQRA